MLMWTCAHVAMRPHAYFWHAMKLVVEVKDSKVEFFLELLRNLPFVKARRILDPKEEVLESVGTAVEELNMAEAGKLKGRPVKDLLVEG